jgi:hypothetical protein
MSLESQSLHSNSSQVVDPTFTNLSSLEPRVKIRQSLRVPIRGARKEKRTQNLYEVLIVSVFLLFLFLTGCSGSMIAPGHTGAAPEAHSQLTGEANLPPLRDGGASSETPENGSPVANSNVDPALFAFIQQDAVIERVRLVVGWLKFVGQLKSAEMAEAGWARLTGGRQLGALRTDSVQQRPDISIRELILWRQILRVRAAPLSQDEAHRIEALAISLTSAMTPEDVAKLDNLLVVQEQVAEY